MRKEAYTTDQVDAQLDDQFKKFLENRGKGLQIDRGKKRVTLSKIFDWFEDDFKPKGGVLPFLSRYVPEKDRAFLKKRDVDVSYLDYNWDLNKK